MWGKNKDRFRDIRTMPVWELDRIHERLGRIELGVNRLLAQAGDAQRREFIMANDLQTILDKVTAQKGEIASVKQLVIELKAHQNDPAKLAEIVAGLDENSVELAVIANPDLPPVS